MRSVAVKVGLTGGLEEEVALSGVSGVGGFVRLKACGWRVAAAPPGWAQGVLEGSSPQDCRALDQEQFDLCRAHTR